MSENGFLTLTRRSGESVLFETSDGQIRVKVARDLGYADRFKLYVQAPRAVRVRRAELEPEEAGAE